MELVASHISATLPREKFSVHTVFHHTLFPGFITRTPFHQIPLEFSSQFISCMNRNRRFEVFALKKEHLWVSEQVYSGQTEGGEEPHTSSCLEDDLSFLSLSEKPDRNMALLDDYEAEELDYDSHTDHRSGLSLLISQNFLCVVNQLLWIDSVLCELQWVLGR